MNQHNISKTPDVLVKRKRGRPRKNENMPRIEKNPTQPPLIMAAPPPPAAAAVMTTIQPQPANIVPTSSNVKRVDHSLVGQAVTCVIDGIFDNGYLLSTRLGPNNSILRGIVFQQGHVAPLTPTNDVAPHVEMCTRGEYTIPPSNQRIPIQICTPQSVCAKEPAQNVMMQNYQNIPPMATGGSSTSAPHESLRLVEQDEVMQVFEVSKTVEEPHDFDHIAKNEHVVSDPMAESFPENGAMDIQKAMEDQPVVNENPNEQCVKVPNAENPELIVPAEAVVENQPTMANHGMQQEIQEQTGEVNNMDANQDPNQAVAVDLSVSNFPEA
nr:histone acetyltransferase p300-like isoform X3 [Tanacetum cinerariifolium]